MKIAVVCIIFKNQAGSSPMIKPKKNKMGTKIGKHRIGIDWYKIVNRSIENKNW